MIFLKDNLIEIVRNKALKIATRDNLFILPSGKTSTFHLDYHKIALDPHGAMLIGNNIMELLRNRWAEMPNIQAIGGHASSIVTATILASLSSMRSRVTAYGPERNMHPMKGFNVRETADEYGLFIEGSAKPGTAAVIIEGVTSTGQRALEDAQRACSFGLEVIAIISVMDRKEGAMENIEENRYDFYPILTIDDIGVSEDGTCFIKTESEKVRGRSNPEWLVDH